MKGNMVYGDLDLHDCNMSLFACLQLIPYPVVDVLESRLLNPLPAIHTQASQTLAPHI